MGLYKYGGRKLKLAANFMLYGVPVSLSAYLVVDYVYADSSRSFFFLFPPSMRLYALAASVAFVVGFAYAGYRRMLSGLQVEGDIWIEAGKLRMSVRRGNRSEAVELDIRELTFVENDDERMRIASSKGEYVFSGKGFVSVDAYEKFRMEMTCEKYKK